MRHIYRNIILLMTVLCLLAGTAAAEEAPATPTDLEPTPQGLIEAEIQKADKTVRLENEARIFGTRKKTKITPTVNSGIRTPIYSVPK